MQHYANAWSKYAVFSGRATREEYWMFVLINFLVCLLLMIVSAAMDSNILYNLYSLAVFVPSLSVGVRRMHDTSRSGWWTLAPIINLIFLIEDSTRHRNQYDE